MKRWSLAHISVLILAALLGWLTAVAFARAETGGCVKLLAKQYEIRADGATVTLTINGREVNRATGCDVASGRIVLTAEGNPIEFRNVQLQPLK